MRPVPIGMVRRERLAGVEQPKRQTAAGEVLTVNIVATDVPRSARIAEIG